MQPFPISTTTTLLLTILSTLLPQSLAIPQQPPSNIASPSPSPPSSNCTFYPHYGFATTHNNAQPRGDARAHVFIYNKTTVERGVTGQGLHDNLLGECGRSEVSGWGAGHEGGVEVLTREGRGGEGRVTGYEVWFDVGGVGEPGCIERAIWDAEGQRVGCVTVGS